MKRKKFDAVNTMLAAMILFFIAAPVQLAAKGKKQENQKATQEDGIRVIAHVELQGAQRNLLRTEHWRRQYLYMQSLDGKELTVFDVTAPGTPTMVQRIPMVDHEENLTDIVGTAALITNTQSEAAVAPPRNISIMSFAEPNHPRVVQQFIAVTGMLRDRGFIYLVNADGLWVLQEQPAEDKALDEEYSNYVLYNR